MLQASPGNRQPVTFGIQEAFFLRDPDERLIELMLEGQPRRGKNLSLIPTE